MMASLDDIPALIGVDKAASMMFAPTGLLPPEALQDHVPAKLFEAEIPLGNVFAAKDHLRWPVGFAMVRHRGSGLYLDQVSVHPDHGQKGIGRSLVVRVLAEAEARKLPHVSLSTFRDLPWNGPFYTSLGFKELSRDRLEPYMLEIEAAQRPHMDVSKRCFMRRTVRRPLLSFGRRKQDR